MRVVAGCYDGSIHGWEGDLSSTTPEKAAPDSGEDSDAEPDNAKEDVRMGTHLTGDVELKFAYSAHDSCVKCLSIMSGRGGRIMASGGSDETIRVYDIAKRREIGELTMHDDTVTCLDFIGSSHLLSGGNDGKVCIWRTRDWECVHVLKGHKEGPVTSLAARHCGAVALSTSRDNSLRMWNLLTGKPASRNRLADYKTLDLARWAPDGETYACVADDNKLLIFSIADTSGQPAAVVPHKRRVNALMFLDESLIVTGSDDGHVRVFGIDGSPIRSYNCSKLKHIFRPANRHLNIRVRSLTRVARADQGEGADDEEDMAPPLVCAGLSNGQVFIWDVMNESDNEAGCILSARTTAHITCLVGDFIDKQPAAEQDAESTGEQDAESTNAKPAPEESAEDEPQEQVKSTPSKKKKKAKATKRKAKGDVDAASASKPKKTKKKGKETSKKGKETSKKGKSRK